MVEETDDRIIRKDEEITIKLNTLEINGRRINKSIFNQLLIEEGYNSRVVFEGNKVLGFVFDRGKRVMIFLNEDNLLRKQILPEHWFYPDNPGSKQSYVNEEYPRKKMMINGLFETLQIFI